MKKVYVCSPLKDDVWGNIERAKKYAKYVFECDAIPVVSHFYALVLNDEIKSQRELGMKAGLDLLFFCNELWIFGETISDGMEKEIRIAEALGLKIRKIKDKDLKKILGGMSYE